MEIKKKKNAIQKQWNIPKIEKLKLIKTQGAMVSGLESNAQANNGNTLA